MEHPLNSKIKPSLLIDVKHLRLIVVDAQTQFVRRPAVDCGSAKQTVSRAIKVGVSSMETQTIILILLGLLLINYFFHVWMSRVRVQPWEGILPSSEGFADLSGQALKTTE
jgi:hypothetical protein